ncbi:MAG: hypothetical protein HY554_14185 [Elusimicrobia bacterium]|nr:hypothetical protein [Elusimicrobiota bacterium]
MGILRTREEYLPVTCAILKAEDRDAFFASIRKQAGSRPDQIARLCEVTADVVNDWTQGKANVPYHTLQMLAHQFQVPLPPVGELRREYLAVAQVASRRETPTPPPPSQPKRRERKAEREGKAPRRERPQQPKAQRPSKPKGEPQQRKRRERPSPPPSPARSQAQRPKRGKEAAEPKGPRVPGPSAELAYWVGVAIMTTRREPDALVMSADRRIGQNFAGSWASLTREIFGVKPVLQRLDDGKRQEARLPAASLEEFLDRLELKADRKPGEAPVPRWAWSNPAWKTACLKGIVDACVHFQRAPSLLLHALPERLAKSVEKMLTSLGFKPELGTDGTIALRGAEGVDRYFETVGTSNMKLRDQYKAHQQPRRGGRPEGAPDASLEPGPETGDAGGERVIAEEVEAADEEAEVSDEQLAEQTLGSEAGPDETLEAAETAGASGRPRPTVPAEAPPPAKPRPIVRRRKTLFRGRP